MTIVMWLAIMMIAACDDRRNPIAPDANLDQRETSFDGNDFEVQDIEAVDVHVSGEPWDSDLSSISEALARADGRALIGLKASTADRVELTGRREAVTAAQLRAGLEFLDGLGVAIEEYLPLFGIAIGVIPEEAVVPLSRSARVDFVTPNEPIFTATSTSPNSEARASSQSTPTGISMVRAPAVWDFNDGSGNVDLLVIDTGLEDHEDLAAVPSGNCLDMNGCSDEIVNPHGTHMLGTIAARNNSIGVVGVAPGLEGSRTFVWSACFVDEDLRVRCNPDKVCSAFHWAAENGIDVVNASFGGPTDDPSVSTAVATAVANDIVIAAGAGNLNGEYPGGTVIYPANYPDVLGVSGVLFDSTFASSDPCSSDESSNHGSHVDLAAPWEANSTVRNDAYAIGCGTSPATAHVSGAAVLLRAEHPTWTAAQVRDTLTANAHDLGPTGWDEQFGHGLVDIPPALFGELNASISGPISVNPPFGGCTTETWSTNPTGGATPYSYEWKWTEFSSGLTAVHSTTDSVSLQVCDGDPDFTWTLTVESSDQQIAQDFIFVNVQGGCTFCEE